MEPENKYEFNQVYTEHKDRVTQITRTKIRDKGKVADIVQDVFSVLYENLIANNPIQNISAWLVGVTRFKVLEAMRSDKKFGENALVEGSIMGEEDERPLYLHEILPDTKGLPDSDMFNAFIKNELEKAIEQLPEEQKWVFIRHEIEGDSFNVLSEESGVPLPTLLSRKHYAVKNLKQRLKDVYYEYKQNN